MEFNTSLAVLLGVLLLMGGFAIGIAINKEKIVEVEKTVPVEKIVEVEKIVNVEVPGPSLLDKAVSDFMKAIELEEDEAGNEITLMDDYNVDFDEISVKKIYDEYVIVHDGDKSSIEFSIKLKFDEEDQPSERVKFDVLVEYEEDEDTEITIL